MKKLASFLLAAALCCTAAVPAFAADVTTQDTTLTYSVNTDYIVTIPEQVALDEEIIISSSKANTEPNMAVKVRISDLTADGAAELTRTDNTDYKITAAAKQNNAGITNNTIVAQFADVTAETKADAISFEDPASPDGGEIKAGSYTGSLTFTVSYEEV